MFLWLVAFYVILHLKNIISRKDCIIFGCAVLPELKTVKDEFNRSVGLQAEIDFRLESLFARENSRPNLVFGIVVGIGALLLAIAFGIAGSALIPFVGFSPP